MSRTIADLLEEGRRIRQRDQQAKEELERQREQAKEAKRFARDAFLIGFLGEELFQNMAIGPHLCAEEFPQGEYQIAAFFVDKGPMVRIKFNLRTRSDGTCFVSELDQTDGRGERFSVDTDWRIDWDESGEPCIKSFDVQCFLTLPEAVLCAAEGADDIRQLVEQLDARDRENVLSPAAGPEQLSHLPDELPDSLPAEPGDDGPPEAEEAPEYRDSVPTDNDIPF